MTDIQLKRSHTGEVTLYVAGVPARGAIFTGMNPSQVNPGKVYANFSIPLDHLSFAEVDNVVPFVRPVDSRETRNG